MWLGKNWAKVGAELSADGGGKWDVGRGSHIDTLAEVFKRGNRRESACFLLLSQEDD